MPIDPSAIPTTPEGRKADKLRELERRIDAIERMPSVQTVSGAPSAAIRDGALVGDQTNVRLWLRLNGTWRYVTLT